MSFLDDHHRRGQVFWRIRQAFLLPGRDCRLANSAPRLNGPAFVPIVFTAVAVHYATWEHHACAAAVAHLCSQSRHWKVRRPRPLLEDAFRDNGRLSAGACPGNACLDELSRLASGVGLLLEAHFAHCGQGGKRVSAATEVSACIHFD